MEVTHVDRVDLFIYIRLTLLDDTQSKKELEETFVVSMLHNLTIPQRPMYQRIYHFQK